MAGSGGQRNSKSDMDWTRRIHEPFLYAALTIALTAGFGYGALIVGSVALGIVPGTWWGAVIQAHGHAQLFGWVGLFVLGMGFFFLPRLRGVRLQNTERLPYAFALLVSGLGLRVIAQPALGFNPLGEGTIPVWQIAWGISALLELAGIMVIDSMLLATLRVSKPLTTESPAYPVEPFAQMVFLSLNAALVVNLLGVWTAIAQDNTTLAAAFNNLVVTLLLYGVVIPMAVVFSFRNLPLFLRLAMPPRKGVRRLARFYAIALCLVILPFLGAIAGDLFGALGRPLSENDIRGPLLDMVQAGGAVLLNVCVLVFIWQIDLARRRPPWIVDRVANTRPDLDYLRKPTRAAYPDAGEYGRFELLIYSAYAWLLFAAVLNLARVASTFVPQIVVSQDAARHALTVGFITLLIFGMAPRMAPGFSQKKGVAYPRLVLVTFVLGNIAAFLRVLPTFLPSWDVAITLWGFSGLFGWTAVAVLAVNLVTTFRRA
ncbi:MAG: NnrS family protein [Anaerolineae bacterium]|nr:NnrS family protein [Anaerolineae bacterium]